MTILIHFHQSHYRTFKAYYTEHVLLRLRPEFSELVSYNRFVELMPTVFGPIAAYLQQCRGYCSGISFVDSTAIRVCHNKRIPRHRVLTAWRSVARPPWVGFTASNSIWWSMTGAKC